MKKLLFIILLLPLLTYSQPNGIFKSIRVNNLKVLDNDGIIHIHDTIKLDQPLTGDTLRFYDSEVGLITLSELVNKNEEIEIGDNLLKAIAILSVAVLCIVGIINLARLK